MLVVDDRNLFAIFCNNLQTVAKISSVIQRRLFLPSRTSWLTSLMVKTSAYCAKGPGFESRWQLNEPFWQKILNFHEQKLYHSSIIFKNYNFTIFSTANKVVIHCKIITANWNILQNFYWEKFKMMIKCYKTPRWGVFGGNH